MISRDTANAPEQFYACPVCDFLRDAPTSDCDACGYEPEPIPDDDAGDPGSEAGDLAIGSDWIARSLGSALGIALLALVMLMGIAGVFGDPDRVNRGIMRLLAAVLS